MRTMRRRHTPGQLVDRRRSRGSSYIKRARGSTAAALATATTTEQEEEEVEAGAPKLID